MIRDKVTILQWKFQADNSGLVSLSNKHFSLKKVKTVLSLAAMLSVITFSQNSFATSKVENCGPGRNGLKVFNYNLNLNTNSNQPGAVSGWGDQGSRSKWSIGGHCGLAISRKSPVYWTFVPSAGVTYEQTGSDRWLNIPNNNLLQVGVRLYVDGQKRQLVDVPDNRVSNECKLNCPLDALAETASLAQIRVRVKQPFVGQTDIPSQRVIDIYGETNNTNGIGEVAAIVNVGLKVIVPQSCSIKTGDVITFDFKDIGTNQFTGIGVGVKPSSVTIQSESMTLECKSMAAQQMLKAILKAPNVSGNMIVANNGGDVGFQIADTYNNVLIPNNDNSKIPIKLDNTGKSNIELKAWPVSVTGNTPKAGAISSTAHISIQFD